MNAFESVKKNDCFDNMQLYDKRVVSSTKNCNDNLRLRCLAKKGKWQEDCEVV